MNLIQRLWKRLWCDHEWKMIREGSIREIEQTIRLGTNSFIGFYRDYECEKCKKAKHVEWK